MIGCLKQTGSQMLVEVQIINASKMFKLVVFHHTTHHTAHHTTHHTAHHTTPLIIASAANNAKISCACIKI